MVQSQRYQEADLSIAVRGRRKGKSLETSGFQSGSKRKRCAVGSRPYRVSMLYAHSMTPNPLIFLFYPLFLIEVDAKRVAISEIIHCE